MKKSFKRTIAVLLAVLMAMFSMPLSALAWTSDSTVPDIDFDLSFRPLYNSHASAGDIVDIRNYDGGSANVTLDCSGLQGPELDYDGSQITINETKLANWMSENGAGIGDYEGDLSTPYGVGDYFAVTFIYKNIDEVAAAGAYIKYSDNIVPAMVYGSGRTSRNANANIIFSTYEDYLADTNATKLTDKGVLVDAGLSGQGADELYANVASISDIPYELHPAASNPNSEAKGRTNDIYIGVTGTAGPFSTADGCSPAVYSDENSYDEVYANCLVAETFAFKIVDDGPITFTPDIDETKEEGFNTDALLIHNKLLSQEPIQATYYQTSNPATNPGSAKISFMGVNPYSGGPVATDYTVNFLDAQNGNEIATFTGPEGTAVTVPNLADYTTAPDSEYHYNASWNEVPVTAIGTENKTYYVVNTPVAHTFGEKNYSGDYHGTTLGPATHAAAGHYTQTCSECGTVVLGEEAALAEHTYGDATVTLAADGTTVTENRVCTVDGAKDTSAQITYEDTATAGQAATCTAAGTKFVRAKVTYSDNYVAYSNEVEVTDPTKPATGHTYDTENIAWTWSGDYSNATATATYSCTAGDDTQSDVPAAMTYVDNAQTEKRTYTAKISIDGVEYSDTKEYALPHDHTWSAEKVEIPDTRVTATCKTAGGYYEAYQCTKCNEFDDASKEWVDLGLDATNHEGPVVDVPAKAETCEEAGYTAGKYCEACETYTEGHAQIPAKGHNYGPVQFTWNDDNTSATAAKVCANDASHVINYEVDMSSVVTKRPTIKDAGITTYTAIAYDAEDNEVGRESKEVTTAAKGANIRVMASNGGFVTGTVITQIGQENYKNVPYGESYSLEAVAADGYKFVGWQIGSKVVSDKTKYSDVAVKNIAITPLFVEEQGDTITVIFYDMYGNVIASYNDVTKDAFHEAMANGAPEAPAYIGYTFTRYSMSDAELLALEESAQVWAQYDKAATTTYNVTVTNGTIVSATSGEISGSTLTGAAYDTKVTVSGEGVEAWKLNGTISGYGDTFTFYVGTDSTVEGVALTEAAKPEVSIISATALDNGIDYTLLATSSVPAGYTVKSRGFIYGKEAADEELTFDNVGNATALGGGAVVKELQNKMNGVDQFALTYGLSAKTGTFRAKAYIIVNGPNGVETILSDAYTVTYA